jgi:hypothetical protein
MPFDVRTEVTRGQADREFRQGRRQRTAPAQIFAETLQVAACLWRTDKDLERTAKAAAPTGDDLVMHFLLRRSHLGQADLSVAGHPGLPERLAAPWF